MIGLPIQANNLGQREFARLIKAANVKRITFHGMRHTCATLLLQAGEPVHVVSKRLGHARVEITLNTYAHDHPTCSSRPRRRWAPSCTGSYKRIAPNTPLLKYGLQKSRTLQPSPPRDRDGYEQLR